MLKLLVVVVVGVVVLLRVLTLRIGFAVVVRGPMPWLPALVVAAGTLAVDGIAWVVSLGVPMGSSASQLLVRGLVWFLLDVSVRSLATRLAFRITVGRAIAVCVVQNVIEQGSMGAIALVALFGMFASAR